MELAIVTGGSRGLGYETSRMLLERGIRVIGISRSINATIDALIKASNGHYVHIAANLADASDVSSVMQQVCTRISSEKPEKVYVVNNAGTVEPIERLGHLDDLPIQQAIQLNMLAPMLINNRILQQLDGEKTELVIVNVTSGAAERVIHGWGVYCTTKAAIEMHTKTAGLEQEQAGLPHKVIAFSPGIMDTEMQETIRSAAAEAFADHSTFVGFKENGKLRPPATVAGTLVNLILNEPLVNGKVYDVNDLISR
ncbi:SDR family NAD(P)-dependent oxidoreductase [Sporolactobacillus terrae]|uniref:Benzil reductase ((S)-benzoin forming) n=1 Tax=Sporolactobacillus terrae TaxID=269673 RepID=A0A5K7WSL0_9BACL|nr:SDR family NAD(P)-dependent oxidoreductase [Sporolactobacillus terrae]BBN97661.1 benzil reductase ((S)-benzoin forming) [Sporolactobacillus terrae]